MKRIASFALALFMTAAAVLSFQLAHSQTEPANDQVIVTANCLCADSKGILHNYGSRTACLPGGNQECTDGECPTEPSYCV